MYDVVVDWAPAYELLASLRAFVNKPERKTLELGATWSAEAARRVDAQIMQPLSPPRRRSCLHLLDLLAWLRPGEQSVEQFLDWVASRSAGALYEILGPYLQEADVRLLHELIEGRDSYMTALAHWNERYFRDVDPRILDGLAANAAELRRYAATAGPDDVIDAATNGIRLDLDPAPRVVLLIPQYHYRPWNLYSNYRGLYALQYPADAIPPEPGEPPPPLVRLTRALADVSRLRILRYLVRESLSFTALVRLTGLSKSTVHYHMVLLRAAGLVRVYHSGDGSSTYSLRSGAIDGLSDRLSAFLTME